MNILVISNNCFAQNNSNGRILGCLFEGIRNATVRQFHIVSGANDFGICRDYLHIGDREVVRTFFQSKKNLGKIIRHEDDVTNQITQSDFSKSVKKNSFTALARELAWSCNKNVLDSICSWIDINTPNIILLQAGDSAFMYNLAMKVAKKYNAPLVIFNTEYYYFEDRNWFDGNNKSLLFKLYKKHLRKTVDAVMEYAKISIYNSEWLKSKYDNHFHKPSTFIYQSSDIHLQPNLMGVKKRLVYVGNFSFNRHLPIIEIAKTMTELSSDYEIEAYGPASEIIVEELKKQPNLSYKGIIPYCEVQKVLVDSKLLLLVESLDSLNSKLTEYGFSTKITDYMGTGVPILAYGSINNVGISYLKKEDAAFVANTPLELRTVLKESIFNDIKRLQIVKTALAVSMRNHNSETNSNKFYNILSSVTNKQV